MDCREYEAPLGDGGVGICRLDNTGARCEVEVGEPCIEHLVEEALMAIPDIYEYV